jgi:two-component system, cell cycle sensor histidine kinase and response regulator CckA
MGIAGADPSAQEFELAARLAAIVESSDDAILTKTLDGVITSWNSGAARMYGYRPEEIIGQNVAVLIPAQQRAELGPILGRLRRGERVEPFETKRRRKDGTIVDVSVCISPIRNQQGTVTGASAVARDIAERKKDRSREQELRRSDRLETLGQLAGGIAHDFNNLLAAITNYAGFIAEATAARPRVQADAVQIQAVASRGARLARQLLIFGRQEPAEPALIDLNTLLSDTQELLRTSLGAHIEVRVTPADQPALVLADRSRVQQMLLNLAVNARDAMPDGGGFRVTVRHIELGEGYAAAHPGLAPGRHVQLSVRDTGHGMSPEVAAHVFEPFFTTKEGGEGTGLGLSTVYGIVTQAGGCITVDSSEGDGSTFHVYLPAATAPKGARRRTGLRSEGSEERATRATREEGGSEGGTGRWVGLAEAQRSRVGGKRRETILIVDDEPSVLAVTSRILRQHGYPTMEAGTGDEALILAATRDFQLLLTDSVMPGMNGPTLAERVAALRPGLPIIPMSGSDDTARARPPHTPGSEQAYIQKPFTASDLIGKVRAALAAAAAHPPGPAG